MSSRQGCRSGAAKRDDVLLLLFFSLFFFSDFIFFVQPNFDVWLGTARQPRIGKLPDCAYDAVTLTRNAHTYTLFPLPRPNPCLRCEDNEDKVASLYSLGNGF